MTLEVSKNQALESIVRLSDFCQWGSVGNDSKSHTVPIILIFHWFPHKTATGWDEGPWNGMVEYHNGSHRNKRFQPECDGFTYEVRNWLYWFTDVSPSGRAKPDMYFCDKCVRAWEWQQNWIAVHGKRND